MSSEKERAGIRKFVRRQLRDEPDLSKLTLGLLKRQYMVHVGLESLSPKAKAVMKQVVEEELANMQDSQDDESDCEVEEPRIKRKREKQEEESEEENQSRTKKRRSASSASESEDKTGSEDERQSKSSSESEKNEVKKSSSKRNPECKEEPVTEESTDDEMNKSKSKSNESVCSSPEQKLNGQKITEKAKNEEIKNTKDGKKTSESNAESSSDKSDAGNGVVSSKNERNVFEDKRDNGSDSDSSSLPSLEEEKDQDKRTKEEKKKTKNKDETSKSRKPDGEKAIVRLKRYISLCGVRKNYKKMLEGCKSIKAKVAVLKKELEDLGVQGNPSIEKCKKIRLKREEAQEVAELDVGNIITTQGRPKRRGVSAQQEYNESPSSAYQRTFNSSSGSDQENQTSREPKKISDWSNLRGIISDDGDSS